VTQPLTPAAAAGAGPGSFAAAGGPVEADLIAAAVLACPAVAGLHAGGGVRQVATYLPGRRVPGVRVDEAGVQVSVVAAPGVRLPAVAAQVRSALTGLAGRRPVDVHIADVALPEPRDDRAAPAALPGSM
jgi:hypothetical protein